MRCSEWPSLYRRQGSRRHIGGCALSCILIAATHHAPRKRSSAFSRRMQLSTSVGRGRRQHAPTPSARIVSTLSTGRGNKIAAGHLAVWTLGTAHPPRAAVGRRISSSPRSVPMARPCSRPSRARRRSQAAAPVQLSDHRPMDRWDRWKPEHGVCGASVGPETSDSHFFYLVLAQRADRK